MIKAGLGTQRRLMPDFFTLAFLILAGSHAGPEAGLSTIDTEPVKQWTLLVPLSLSSMLVCPRVAAFKAAPRGCFETNTWSESLPSLFSSTKYFLSLMVQYLRRISMLLYIYPFPRFRLTARLRELKRTFRRGKNPIITSKFSTCKCLCCHYTRYRTYALYYHSGYIAD